CLEGLDPLTAHLQRALPSLWRANGCVEGDVPLREWLLRKLLDHDERERIAAAETFEYLGAAAATPEVLARLAALARDAHPGVRRAAAQAFGQLGAAAATPEVLARLIALTRDGDWRVRRTAAQALGQLGAAAATPEVLARLAALTHDVDPGVRRTA